LVLDPEIEYLLDFPSSLTESTPSTPIIKNTQASLILANAGTGKTTTITAKIIYTWSKMKISPHPRSIALTFSKEDHADKCSITIKTK